MPNKYKMKKSYQILVFLILIQTFSLNSQSTNQSLPTSIHLRLPGIFNIHHQDAGLGISFPLSKKLMLELGTSFIFNIEKKSNTVSGLVGRFGDRGIIFQIDPKYIINSNHEMSEYVGMRISYNIHNYTSTRYLDDNLTQTISYQVNNKALHVGAIFGIQRKNVLFSPEFSLGLGIRFLNVNNNALRPISEYSKIYRLNPYFTPEEKGNYVKGNIIFGTRLNFALKK
jgi:hypothetical protein